MKIITISREFGSGGWEQKPLNLFASADTQSKLARCQQRAEAGEQITERDLLRKMKQIDKERVAYRALFTESDWGKKAAYQKQPIRNAAQARCIPAQGRAARNRRSQQY